MKIRKKCFAKITTFEFWDNNKLLFITYAKNEIEALKDFMDYIKD